MLTLFVFDERESRREEDLPEALKGLDDNAMLWVALCDPSEEEVATVREALELSDEQAQRLLEQPSRASLVDAGEHMHVTLYVASSEEGDPVLHPVECVLGSNWVVTSHEAEIGVLEEFRERAEGGGQVGALDAPSFVAAVVEWVVTSYFRAFEAVENELEELDAKVMSDIPKSVSDDLARLVELRRSIGTLRRALAPHREVVAAPQTSRSTVDRARDVQERPCGAIRKPAICACVASPRMISPITSRAASRVRSSPSSSRPSASWITPRPPRRPKGSSPPAWGHPA